MGMSQVHFLPFVTGQGYSAGLASAVLLSGVCWTLFLIARQGFMIDVVPATHRRVWDFSRDGMTDLFVTNSRGQLHAAYRSARVASAPYTDARPDLAAVIGTHSTATSLLAVPGRPRWTRCA